MKHTFYFPNYHNSYKEQIREKNHNTGNKSSIEGENPWIDWIERIEKCSRMKEKKEGMGEQKKI